MDNKTNDLLAAIIREQAAALATLDRTAAALGAVIALLRQQYGSKFDDLYREYFLEEKVCQIRHQHDKEIQSLLQVCEQLRGKGSQSPSVPK